MRITNEYTALAMAIVGRKKEMIIRSGFNVYPAEVEAALNALPQVQSGVVGRKTADGNKETVAFVQFSAGAAITPEQIQLQLRDHIAAYKCPGRIVLLDSLPIGPTGKI
jgi:acyl-CoA synthetase (AMP-forming)/AMP-acid ligase II